MVWKIRRKSKENMLKHHSSTGSSESQMVVRRTSSNKLPKRSCLKRDSLDSDWSSAASSVTSSQRSDTYKCDHISCVNSGEVPMRTSADSGSADHSSSSQLAESLDSGFPAPGRVSESLGSVGLSISSRPASHMSATSSSPSLSSKAVRFSVVEIRDYDREMSDNPSCSSGPPIG